MAEKEESVEESESEEEIEEQVPKKSVGYSKHKRDLKLKEKDNKKTVKRRLVRNAEEEDEAPVASTRAYLEKEDNSEDEFF